MDSQWEISPGTIDLEPKEKVERAIAAGKEGARDLVQIIGKIEQTLR